MVKVFCANANGKIELTEKELEELLQQAYSEGKAHGQIYYPYTISTNDKWDLNKIYYTTGTNDTNSTADTNHPYTLKY